MNRVTKSRAIKARAVAADVLPDANLAPTSETGRGTPPPVVAPDADMLDAKTMSAAAGILTIDLDALAANWKSLASRGVPAECAAVVKANGYGCGLVPVTRKLAASGCKTFFVATLDEARAARTAASDAAIYVLDGFFAGCGEDYAQINCQPVIGDIGELAEWDAFRAISGWRGLAALHIDTGMNRLGVSIAEAQGLIERVKTGDHGFSLVMSHLVSAENLGASINARQVAAFREVASAFTGIPASLSNSSGIFLGTRFHFDMMRPGAALYGVNPTPESDTPMRDVIDLKARIVQIRNVAPGDTVGYGGTWTARQPTRLAIVSAGYADGYFRSAGGVDNVRSAQAIMAGVRCPIAGRISMDLMAIDITGLAHNAVRRGQFVTLIGEGLGVDELAHHFGTIGYEVLTSLGHRYARVYKSAGA